jgi:hypothetical protein
MEGDFMTAQRWVERYEDWEIFKREDGEQFAVYPSDDGWYAFMADAFDAETFPTIEDARKAIVFFLVDIDRRWDISEKIAGHLHDR